MTLALLAVLLCPFARAAAPAAPAASSPALAQSTQTVSSLYPGDRLRDPFLPASAGSGAAPARREEEPSGPAVVDIHSLSLRGILKDASADFALFSAETGETFMLRAGRLYNDRNKPVAGVTGRIDLRRRLVELFTPEKDRQPFIIGEKKENDEDKRP